MRLRQRLTARWQQVPEGVRDLPPGEAADRAAAVAAVREVFRRWGYREVATPTLEYLETILQGAGPGVADRLVKIVDRGGELLALRPEMTVPIARLAATRLLRQAAPPLRLAYVAPVFRGQEGSGLRLREFTQAGVELLGDAGVDADAEVVALAAAALGRAGVRDAVMHLGDLGFLADALSALPEGEQEEIRLRLYRREFAGAGEEISDAGTRAFLRALPDLQGPGALDRAGRFVRSSQGEASLGRLQAILDRLGAYGAAAAVDLSIIRDFSYYTGTVFEAFGAGTGYPLLGGGRYDTLLARFGADCPATGFALGIERVIEAGEAGEAEVLDAVILTEDTARAEAVRLAGELRDAGRAVVVEGPDAQVPPGARYIVRLRGGEAAVTDPRSGRERLVTREQLIAELGGRPRVPAWTH